VNALLWRSGDAIHGVGIVRLLLTRPEPDATRSAAALRRRGHTVVAAPLMRMQPLAAEFSGTFAAVLITSANAARAIAGDARAGELRALPLFAVGARSAEAAREAGFADVTSADGALADLVRRVATQVRGGTRLLYLAGEDRTGDLAGDLGRHGIAVETAVIYRVAPLDALPHEVIAAIGALDGVLHYSRRSAETLLRLAERAGVLETLRGLAHYCLSAEVARPLRDAGAARLAIAAKADENELFRLL
jgi:uroporphyrinogen-III synthase